MQAILSEAKKGGSLKEAFLAHAGDYGIDNIDVLFPDAKAVNTTPEFIKRDDTWVPLVIDAAHHSPFSRIKSIAADITADEARAKGYVKGDKKIDEVISALKRVTTPTTVYKKQKLDRDDIVDITDFDVVAWLKSEMRVMLNEELARAVLVGDGRNIVADDKIDETAIRPIWTDDDVYAVHKEIPLSATTANLIDAIIRSRVDYKGSGNPTLFTSPTILADMLLLTDGIGRRLYNTEAELASALRVSKIVEVPVLEDLQREVRVSEDASLAAIIVNLRDYTMGADKGGAVSMFDDFDIDYNQQKFLIETRLSGALTKPKSAIVIEQLLQ
jgi:HK97 family phage major capsid protein